MKTIDVIIVNYYSEELVKQCISALKNSDAQGFNLNVIIVSNGTKDNKLLLSFKNDYTSVIDLGYNSGFGKACNIAAKKSSSDYLLFLNPDTLIKKDTLKLVLSMAEQNNYAVLGCKQINKLNKVYNFHTLAQKLIYLFIIEKYTFEVFKTLLTSLNMFP